MLFLLGAWAILIAAAHAIGAGLLRTLHADDGLRRGDRFFLAVWLGVVTLALVLLAVSLFAPLSPWVAAVTAAVAILAVIAAGRGRAEPAPAAPPDVLPAPGSRWAGVALVAIAAALLASDPPTLHDALVYHGGITRWLREHGTVFGTALLHNRLGHVSSWFAISAPFDSGPAAGAAWNVGAGLAVILVALQGSVAAGRIAARSALASDWVLAVSSGALLWAAAVHGAGNPSPDVAATALIVAAAWALCLTAPRAAWAMTDNRRAAGLVPVALATGAVTVKLFAVPAAAVTMLAYAIDAARASRLAEDDDRIGSSRWRGVARRLAAVGGVAAVVMAPFAASNFVASGCPLFPAPFGCLATSWSVGPAAAGDYAEYIREVARWETRRIPAEATSLGWVTGWAGAHPAVAAWLLVTPVLAALTLRLARGSVLRWLMLLAIAGLAFGAWQAPATRFLYGYLVLVPATLVGLVAERRLTRAAARPGGDPIPAGPAGRRAAVGFLAFAAVSSLCVALASQKLNVASAVSNGRSPLDFPARALMFPERAAPPLPLTRHRVNDVEFYTPVPASVFDTLGYRSDVDGDLGFEKCSAAPLPCTPYRPPFPLRLRDPSRGIAGGFVRAPEGP